MRCAWRCKSWTRRWGRPRKHLLEQRAGLVRCFTEMKSLVAVTLTLRITGACLAQKHSTPKQQAQQWRPYVYPDDGFAITLPAQTTPRNDGGDRHIHLYTVRLEGGTIFNLRAVHKLMDCET